MTMRGGAKFVIFTKRRGLTSNKSPAPWGSTPRQYPNTRGRKNTRLDGHEGNGAASWMPSSRGSKGFWNGTPTVARKSSSNCGPRDMRAASASSRNTCVWCVRCATAPSSHWPLSPERPCRWTGGMPAPLRSGKPGVGSRFLSWCFATHAWPMWSSPAGKPWSTSCPVIAMGWSILVASHARFSSTTSRPACCVIPWVRR